ncbi:MAG: hypothetical protein ABI599_00635 [Flavobacteriales bacterium]
MFCIPALLTIGMAFGQPDMLESSCDTTVFGQHYTRCIKDAEGRYIEFGNRNEKGQRHGWWCELRGDATEHADGEYRNDRRIGNWWMGRHEIWKYNRKGEIISKGKACRACPIF